MCGLAALITQSSIPHSNKIERMLQITKHRGPDHSGHYTQDNVCLGHNRLSIIDISAAANQPAFSPDFRYALIYNGELYNYLELKSQLIELGHHFKTTSDTEVFLHGFIEWKEQIFEKFIGMYAFIIYDQVAKEVFWGRDPLGIKPLYSFKDSDDLYFCSEIKGFSQVAHLRPNHKKIAEHFIFSYVAGEDTLFENVYKIAPGHLFGKNCRTNQFFRKYGKELKVNKNSRDKYDQKQLQAEIKLKLNESILMHTMSDVGYNIQLSGGLDSSYVTAVLAQQEHKKIRTYSVELENDPFSEAIYQGQVAEKFHTEHHPLILNAENYFDSLSKSIWHLEAPQSHSACNLLLLLTEQAAKTSKVLITGEGADELFLGYSRYTSNFKTSFKNFLFNFTSPLGSILTDALFAWEPSSELTYVSKKSLTGLIEYKFRSSFREKIYKDFHSLTDRIRMMDQKIYLSSLLERQDKVSMASSVEARVPFCNIRLFDLINALPVETVIPHDETKYILKNYAKDFFSDEFIFRRKNGFRVTYKRNPPPEIYQNVKDRKSALGNLGFKMDNLDLTPPMVMKLHEFSIWSKLFFETSL